MAQTATGRLTFFYIKFHPVIALLRFGLVVVIKREVSVVSHGGGPVWASLYTAYIRQSVATSRLQLVPSCKCEMTYAGCVWLLQFVLDSFTLSANAENSIYWGMVALNSRHLGLSARFVVQPDATGPIILIHLINKLLHLGW